MGFMSFKTNYVSNEIKADTFPNIYITTVIVDPNFRNCGITGRFYDRLQNQFAGYHLFTRTWSENIAHIRILSSHKFYEHERIPNDRGEGIDTIYYHYFPAQRTKTQILKQYKLTGNLLFSSLLVFLTVIFLLIWLFSSDKGIMHELSIAFSTSLIASLLCLISDSFLKYKESKNDEYINSLKGFGISNLQFHKDIVLEAMIPDCKKEIWISGYRLIMTAKTSFLHSIEMCCRKRNGIKIRLLLVPPWTKSFNLIYGDEDVSDNYLKVLSTIASYMEKYKAIPEVRFTEKPIFNDTYKVDDCFVTGPYLHCSNADTNEKITAKDFFSLVIDEPRKELFGIIYNDYTALWEDMSFLFDFEGFYKEYKSEIHNIYKLSKEEKLAFIKKFVSKNQR